MQHQAENEACQTHTPHGTHENTHPSIPLLLSQHTHTVPKSVLFTDSRTAPLLLTASLSHARTRARAHAHTHTHRVPKSVLWLLGYRRDGAGLGIRRLKVKGQAPTPRSRSRLQLPCIARHPPPQGEETHGSPAYDCNNGRCKCVSRGIHATQKRLLAAPISRSTR